MNTVQVLYDNVSEPNGYGLISHLFKDPKRNPADVLFDHSVSVWDKACVGFDNVKPEHFTVYPIQFLNPNQINFNKVIRPLLSTKLVELLKTKTHKVYLLLFLPTEGIQLSWNDYEMLRQIKELADSDLVDKDKILFVYGDLNVKELIEKVYIERPATKSYIPNENIFAYNWFERIASNHITNTGYKLDRYNFAEYTKPTKHFIFKTGNVRPGRLYTYLFLKVNGLLEKGHYSFLDSSNNYELYSDKTFFYNIMRDFTIDRNLYYKEYKKLKKDLPVLLDIPKEGSEFIANTPVFPENLVKDAAIEIVVETHTDIDNKGSLNLTEKTFYPMLYRLPFIVLGSPKLYTYLQQKGYGTFPMLFDEKFSREPNFKKRSQMFCTELERFCNRPLDEISEIISSREVQGTIENNFDVLKSQINEPSKLDLDFFNLFKNKKQVINLNKWER